MRTLVPVAAFLILVSGPARADVTLSDGNYAVVDWITSVVLSTGGASQVTSRSTIGGNPDAYRKTVLTLPAGASMVTAHLYQGGSYNPAVDGPIFVVNYGEDQIQETPPFPGAFIEATPLLEQGGVLYTGPDLTFTNTAWLGASRQNLVALDFTSATNTHPDFSAAGGVIHFGYVRSNTNPGALAANFRSGIDNFSVTVRSGVVGVGTTTGLETLRVLGPNPFRSTVAFRLGMGEAGPVRVSVHDASGRLVRTLARGALTAGTHALSWDGRNGAGRAMPAGLYLVSVEAGGTRAAGRVVKLN
jgi:hypothetical protein